MIPRIRVHRDLTIEYLFSNNVIHSAMTIGKALRAIMPIIQLPSYLQSN